MNQHQKVENAKRWVSDEEQAYKAMERRHREERAVQDIHLARARDALSFARGYLMAQEDTAREHV